MSWSRGRAVPVSWRVDSHHILFCQKIFGEKRVGWGHFSCEPDCFADIFDASEFEFVGFSFVARLQGECQDPELVFSF